MIMTREELILFISRFTDFSTWNPTQQVDYLAFYLINQISLESFTTSDIEECFRLLDLHQYTRLPAYFSENTTKKGGKYIKHEKGYRLERGVYDKIRIIVEAEPKRVQVTKQLIDLILKVKDTQERSFLDEAIRCYRVESYRATIVMVWVLTIDHLQKYTFDNRLIDFNNAIAAHSDKKMKTIISYEDFSEFKESRVIELMRSANIISNDIRKILDEKLGIRNSAGHPSTIQLSGHKTTEFMLDLIENILLKY